MPLVNFFLKAAIYLLSFLVSFYAMRAADYEKLLKRGHTAEAQVLYFLFVFALAYLTGSFFCVFLLH